MSIFRGRGQFLEVNKLYVNHFVMNMRQQNFDYFLLFLSFKESGYFNAKVDYNFIRGKT